MLRFQEIKSIATKDRVELGNVLGEFQRNRDREPGGSDTMKNQSSIRAFMREERGRRNEESREAILLCISK